MQQMVSLLQILFLAQHVSGTTMPIIRLIIPDDVLIQFVLLMMGAVTLETCRDMK
jgi:hypothetical protein